MGWILAFALSEMGAMGFLSRQEMGSDSDVQGHPLATVGGTVGVGGLWELEGQDLCQIDGADPGWGPRGSEKQMDSGWICK